MAHSCAVLYGCGTSLCSKYARSSELYGYVGHIPSVVHADIFMYIELTTCHIIDLNSRRGNYKQYKCIHVDISLIGHGYSG